MGADIVRLWVASVDASSDVKVTMENFQQVSEAYRKIRNTMRFMMLTQPTLILPKTQLITQN